MADIWNFLGSQEAFMYVFVFAVITSFIRIASTQKKR